MSTVLCSTFCSEPYSSLGWCVWFEVNDLCHTALRRSPRFFMKLSLEAGGLERTTRAAFFAYDEPLEALLEDDVDRDSQRILDDTLRAQLATGSAVVERPAKIDSKLRLISGAKRVNVALSRTLSVVWVYGNIDSD